MKITKNGLDTMAGPGDWFDGNVYIGVLSMPSPDTRVMGGIVHFAPGARTGWPSPRRRGIPGLGHTPAGAPPLPSRRRRNLPATPHERPEDSRPAQRRSPRPCGRGERGADRSAQDVGPEQYSGLAGRVPLVRNAIVAWSAQVEPVP
jgi:hypothetical protein